MKNINDTDPLAARIQRERDALDRDMPRADLWDDIATKLEPDVQSRRSKVIALFPALRVAAVLIGLSAVGLWLTRMDRPTDQAGTAVVLEQDLSPANDPMLTDPRFTELRKMESEYARLEQSKTDLILDNPDLSPEDAQEAIDLIDDLENDYDQLRQELEAGADAEKVLAAMVRNYQQRIEVLKRMADLFKPSPPTQNKEEYASSIVL
ncbi:MAG: hypothetical protein GC205_12920 [Bacteroidetes bacterium]|nr:hypothetical protein [Bacteroidota bacterium]